MYCNENYVSTFTFQVYNICSQLYKVNWSGVKFYIFSSLQVQIKLLQFGLIQQSFAIIVHEIAIEQEIVRNSQEIIYYSSAVLRGNETAASKRAKLVERAYDERHVEKSQSSGDVKTFACNGPSCCDLLRNEFGIVDCSSKPREIVSQ